MSGYSQITIRVLDHDGNVILEDDVATNDGFLEFTFQIPDNAKMGTWSLRIEVRNTIFSHDFRVVGGSQ
ncbi:MAG TPA: MG2 domain-containing protein [Nitrososphaera sp.]|nr:MG2 domain-containing protein [Nitrososphaera sp.]